MSAFLIYMVGFRIKSYEELEKNATNITASNYLDTLTVEEDYTGYKELYGQAAYSDVYEVTYDDKPNQVFEEWVQRPWGILGKYDYKILKSFLGSYGQDYVYEMSDKFLLKNEITDLLSKEATLSMNTRGYLKKVLTLVEKSIELKDSTIIIEYEV